MVEVWEEGVIPRIGMVKCLDVVPFQDLESYKVSGAAIPRTGMAKGLEDRCHSKNWTVKSLEDMCHSKNWDGTSSGRRVPFKELEWSRVWKTGAIPLIGRIQGMRSRCHSKNCNGQGLERQVPFRELPGLVPFQFLE